MGGCIHGCTYLEMGEDGGLVGSDGIFAHGSLECQLQRHRAQVRFPHQLPRVLQHVVLGSVCAQVVLHLYNHTQDIIRVVGVLLQGCNRRRMCPEGVLSLTDRRQTRGVVVGGAVCGSAA